MVVAERHAIEPPRPAPLRPPGGGGYWVAVGVLAILAIGAVAAMVVMLLSGPRPRASWGYAAAALGFSLGAAQGAPLLALISRLGRGTWGVPLHRPAELLGLAGLVTAPLAVVLLVQLPASEGRPSIWLGWPGAPLIWNAAAMALLAGAGVAALALSGRPDEAFFGRTVQRGPIRWIGGTRQWRLISAGVLMMGALYAMLYALVQMVVASDLALGLVPGWHSAILPAYLGITGLQAGLAATVLIAAGLRRSDRWRDQIDTGTFRASGKLLLAFALLWFYFWWSEFLTYWYGRTPEEQWLLGLLMFGPYLWPFLLAFLLSFVLPTVLLIWNPIRNSVRGVALAAGLTLAGSLFDRLRIFLAAWTAPVQATAHAEPPPLPAAHWPGPLDAAILVGSVAAVGLLCLLALRLVPPVSLWERRRAERLTVERRMLATDVDVVGRPI